MDKNAQNLPIVEIIDNLGPINNTLRLESDPISKLELMWDFGEILDNYLRKYRIKLHELLYLLYDPHSTKKASNITRDLGSYCYRVFKFFEKKNEIRYLVPNLKSYMLFREAVPLLLNPNYEEVNKKEVLRLLNSNLPNKTIKEKLIDMKQKIRRIKNPRNQKAFQYIDETNMLNKLISNLRELYDLHKELPDKREIENLLGDKKYRLMLSNILLALSNDSFGQRIKEIKEKDLPSTLVGLFSIASGRSEDRSRFRRWVLSSNKLLLLAEGIQALDIKENYDFYRRKVLNISEE